MTNTKQIFKKLISPASLFIFSLAFAIPILVGYILNQNRELQESEIVNEWYDPLKDFESDKRFEELKVIQKNLEKIASDIKESKNNEKYQSKVVECNKQPNQNKIDYLNSWKLSKINKSVYDKVNYEYICNIGNNGGFDIKKTQENNSQIAINFIEKIFDIMNSKAQKISIKDIGEYTAQWMLYFGKDENNQSYNDLKNLEFLWVYIANSEGQMLSYPANEVKDELDLKKRSWWQYAHNHDNKPLNITTPYIDINDNPDKNIPIRTIWYKFTMNKIEYVLCVDIYFYPTQNLYGLDFLKQCIKSASVIKNNPMWSFVIQTLIIYLLSLYIYEKIVKDLLLKNIPSSSSGLINLKLKLSKKHYAEKNADNLVITVQGETRETDETANSREAGWNISFTNLNLNQRNSQLNRMQNQSVYTYESTGKYNLDMTTSQPSYRCVEVWEVFLESRSGNIEKLGFFVATWNTTNSINIEDELNIKSINWEKEYKSNLEAVKAQLYNHLSISEEEEFIGILNNSSNNTVNVPQYLSEINFIKNLIHSNLFLNQRKIILPENEIITEIYKLGDVRAICTRNFLQLLAKNKKIEEFFKVDVQERFYVEHEEEDFKKFYELLEDKYKSFFKNTSPFKIMVYQKNNDNIVKPEDDFCIVWIYGKSSLVVYTLTDNRYPNAGAWISWRNIDVEYYTKLYQYQRDKASRLDEINIYLDRFSL